MLSEKLRNKIITESNKLLGVPFHHASNSSLGMDCRGFIWLVYHRTGIELPTSDGRMYAADWWKHTKEERLLTTFLKKFKYTKEPKTGDILLFRLFALNAPVNHCGIYINNETFVHCFSNKIRGGVHFQTFDYKWMRRFVTFLTYKG